MNVSRPNPDIESVRRQILDAAEERFQTYGYGKTTMAEIARDVDMSAANLYRYFPSKEDMPPPAPVAVWASAQSHCVML